MMSFKHITIIGIIAVALCGGCTSQAQNKANAQARWGKTSARVKLPVAQQQFASGKYSDAEKTVNEILASDANFADAHLLKGEVLMAKGASQAGTEEIKKAVSLDSKLAKGWFILGLCAQEAKNDQQAQQYFDKAVEQDGSNVDYVTVAAQNLAATGNVEAAQKLLNDKMAIMPANAVLKVQYAQLMQRQNKITEAISYYRQAKLLDSSDETISESLGYCYILSTQWELASELFELMSKNCADVQKRQSFLELAAMCNVNAGQFGKAVSSYDKVTLQDRNNAQTWLRMGQAALGSGAITRAYACSQRAIAIQPGYSDAIILEGCAAFADKRYNVAIKSFEQVLTDKKVCAFAYYMLGKSYHRLGNESKARQAFERARLSGDEEIAKYLAKVDGQLK